MVVADGGSLETWLPDNKSGLRSLMEERGCVLLRGFDPVEAESLGRISNLLAGRSIDYRYGVSPRDKLTADVYTSTELEPGLVLPLHNELSFSARWPRWLFLTCLVAAETGGQTPIADSSAVLSTISSEVRDAFESRGITYLRNFGDEHSIEFVSWKQSFETDDPKMVESFCASSGIDLEWRGQGLRTHRRTPAIRNHPEDGRPLWFNQAHLFHSSTLDKRVRRGMLSRLGPLGLPLNALFGDGEIIPSDVIQEVRRAYDLNTVMFDWQPGDVLVLDNMAYAHGRMPFTGPRRVLVAMSDPYEPSEGTLAS